VAVCPELPVKRVFKKTAASCLRILAGVPIVGLVVGGMLLLVLGTTLSGRSVGLSAVVLGSVLFCSIGYWNRKWFRRIRGRFWAVLLPAGLLLYLVPMILAPDGGKADARVRNCHLGGQEKFSRYSPGNVIPEIDQLKVGVSLLRLRDVDGAEAGRLHSLLFPIYDEMDKDADFRVIGSAMGLAYRDLLHVRARPAHYYLILPETTGGRRMPCLIFLHGMGGNMKACLWVLSKLSAGKRGQSPFAGTVRGVLCTNGDCPLFPPKCAVIAPSFGVGNWDRAGSGEFVVAIAREAIATLPLDPKRIFLMGYSNGAMGVTRAAIKEPRLFRGLIYLSAITADESVSTDQLPILLRNHKILFLHGGRDRRIPPGIVEAAAAMLKRRGDDVRLKFYGDEDHYLLFSRQEAVLGDIAKFMGE
jgi:predicted esterase